MVGDPLVISLQYITDALSVFPQLPALADRIGMQSDLHTRLFQYPLLDHIQEVVGLNQRPFAIHLHIAASINVNRAVGMQAEVMMTRYLLAVFQDLFYLFIEFLIRRLTLQDRSHLQEDPHPA